MLYNTKLDYLLIFVLLFVVLLNLMLYICIRFETNNTTKVQKSNKKPKISPN